MSRQEDHDLVGDSGGGGGGLPVDSFISEMQQAAPEESTDTSGVADVHKRQ